MEQRLPDFPSPRAEVVAKYLSVLRVWMCGNMDWESARYRPVAQSEPSYMAVCLAL